MHHLVVVMLLWLVLRCAFWASLPACGVGCPPGLRPLHKRHVVKILFPPETTAENRPQSTCVGGAVGTCGAKRGLMEPRLTSTVCITHQLNVDISEPLRAFSSARHQGTRLHSHRSDRHSPGESLPQCGHPPIGTLSPRSASRGLGKRTRLRLELRQAAKLIGIFERPRGPRLHCFGVSTVA